MSWALSAAVSAGLEEAAVIVSAVSLVTVVSPGNSVIENAARASGQASSLRAAVSWAGGRGLDAVVIGLEDQPLVSAAAWIAVASALAPIGVATFSGRRRPPVKLARSVRQLLPNEGNEGARVLIGKTPDLLCEVF